MARFHAEVSVVIFYQV